MRTVQEELQYLADRQAIEELMSIAARGIDRHDAELVRSVYHPQARHQQGSFEGTADAFVRWVNEAHATRTRAHSCNITTHWAEIDTDVARADTYVLFARFVNEKDLVILGSGRYVDVLERRDGDWRILRRETAIDACLEGDARAWYAAPGGYRTGTWSRADLSYESPLCLPLDLASALTARGPAPAREPTRPPCPLERYPCENVELLDFLLARRAVKSCVVQTCRALDRARECAAREQFITDARVRGGEGRHSAIEYIHRTIDAALREDVCQSRHVTSHVPLIEADRASVETYVIELKKRRLNDVVSVGGVRYLDRMVRTSDRWLIEERTIVVDWEYHATCASFDSDEAYLNSTRGHEDMLWLRYGRASVR